MNKLITDFNDPELADYLDRNIGISRTTLNVQAFIGLFIFGWLMSTTYDSLNEKGLGWTFLIVLIFLIVAGGRQPEPAVYYILASVLYFGAWVHTNLLLSSQQKIWGEKFLALNNETKLQGGLDADNNSSSISTTDSIHNEKVLTAETLNIVNQFSEPEIARFFAFTYEAWKRGELNFYSDTTQKAALGNNLMDFIKSVNASLAELIRASQRIRGFSIGEYLVCYDKDKHFLLTNLAIYFYCCGNLSDKPEVFELRNLKSYKQSSIWKTFTIKIQTNDDKKVNLRKIMQAPPDVLVNHFIRINRL